MIAPAILFDLDGTLIDTAPDLSDTLNTVLARRGRPPVPADDVRVLIGDGARALVRRGLEATGGVPSETAFEEAVTEFFGHYDAHLADRSRPFPGVTEALTELRVHGCKLAVVTNKAERYSVKLLRQLGLADLFEAIVGGDSLPVRKPDPGHLLGTLDRIGAGPGRAVMVGDSLNDVTAARRAGVPVIAVSFGYTRVPPHQLGADLVIDAFSELPAAVARVQPGLA